GVKNGSPTTSLPRLASSTTTRRSGERSSRIRHAPVTHVREFHRYARWRGGGAVAPTRRAADGSRLDAKEAAQRQPGAGGAEQEADEDERQRVERERDRADLGAAVDVAEDPRERQLLPEQEQ